VVFYAPPLPPAGPVPASTFFSFSTVLVSLACAVVVACIAWVLLCYLCYVQVPKWKRHRQVRDMERAAMEAEKAKKAEIAPPPRVRLSATRANLLVDGATSNTRPASSSRPASGATAQSADTLVPDAASDVHDEEDPPKSEAGGARPVPPDEGTSDATSASTAAIVRVVDAMRPAALRDALEVRVLNTSGKKKELQVRLRAALEAESAAAGLEDGRVKEDGDEVEEIALEAEALTSETKKEKKKKRRKGSSTMEEG